MLDILHRGDDRGCGGACYVNGPRLFPEPDSATLGLNPQAQVRTHPATYFYTSGPLPYFCTPEFLPLDAILTKPVGIVPADPTRPGAPDHTEDLAQWLEGIRV